MMRNRRRKHKSTSRRRRHKSELPLPNDAIVTVSNQCCGGYMDAAEAGHLQCLQGLSEAGRFLSLGSPDRASAGESRKHEIWNAAFASCRADHAHMLSWLFESGWPSSFDAVLPWHMGDLLESRDLSRELVIIEKLWDSLMIRHGELREQFLPELDLYCQAKSNPTPACLEALLKAGCRSVWICRLAAQEQKPAFLTLAASWGCPCDQAAMWLAATDGNLPLLEAVHSAASLPKGFLSCGSAKLRDYNTLYSIKRAAEGATKRGDAACLAALLEWFGKAAATSGISLVGGLDCLRALQRVGCLDLKEAVQHAADRAQVECLKYLLDLDPNLVQEPLLLWTSKCRTGPPEAIIDCLEFLQGAGCQWSREGDELSCAAPLGWPELLQYCLERARVCPWDTVMRCASWSASLDCMQVLYDHGYERHRDPKSHPAILILYRSHPLGRRGLECIRYAVRQSGKPDPQGLPTLYALYSGDDILRYVCELGAVLDEETTNAAAAAGRVEVLQYVLAKGAPWSSKTFESAIMGELFDSLSKPPPAHSLGCLQCLHEHARVAGCPEAWERPSERAFHRSYWVNSFGPSLEVLQYVCDHMGPMWADPLLKATAQDLAGEATEMKNDEGIAPVFDWQMVQMVLYLARKLKHALPHPLGELVATRRERAAALAGVFFKAGRLAHTRKRSPSPSLALWDAVGRVPSELQERIASQAHLILL
eukprot:jgi/Botrbrau1/8813/Bobra.0335s0003.1